jgi:hypothetical protein
VELEDIEEELEENYHKSSDEFNPSDEDGADQNSGKKKEKKSKIRKMNLPVKRTNN